MDFSSPSVIDFIKRSLQEDVGSGDHSSLASIPSGKQGKAQLIFKEIGMVAGLELAIQIFNTVDKDLKIELFKKDGDAIKYGDIGLHVSGCVHSILISERLVLNCMQRLSGIATITNKVVKKIEGTNSKILDTRKTTPGLRMFEKWAVTIGGGENHRFALYDMIMLKDNHIDFAGGITNAITKTKEYLKSNNKDLKIIVEARNLDEIKEILQNDGVFRILIDNFNFQDTKTAVALIGDQCLTESSGNINENTIREYAECGVNYISSGALTHSVYNMDLSLKAV